MFYSLKLIEFGKQLMLIRKENNLTRSAISEQIGINIDTIRRIEKGLVLPKIDTLIILSEAYKVDLLNLFIDNCSDEYLRSIYDEIDNVLEKEKKDNIDDFCKTAINMIENLENNNSLFFEIEKVQLIYLLKGIRHSTNTEDLNISTNFLLEGIRCTHPSISFNKLSKIVFTEIEIKLLYLIAANYLDEYKVDESINILQYILNLKENNLTDKIKIKAYALLAYNFFLKQQYEESLVTANNGLELARNIRTTYYVHSLLARKAVVLKRLNKEGFEENMRICLSILEFENRRDLIEHYKKVCKEYYGVEI